MLSGVKLWVLAMLAPGGGCAWLRSRRCAANLTPLARGRLGGWQVGAGEQVLLIELGNMGWGVWGFGGIGCGMVRLSAGSGGAGFGAERPGRWHCAYEVLRSRLRDSARSTIWRSAGWGAVAKRAISSSQMRIAASVLPRSAKVAALANSAMATGSRSGGSGAVAKRASRSS